MVDRDGWVRGGVVGMRLVLMLWVLVASAWIADVFIFIILMFSRDSDCSRHLPLETKREIILLADNNPFHYILPILNALSYP